MNRVLSGFLLSMCVAAVCLGRAQPESPPPEPPHRPPGLVGGPLAPRPMMGNIRGFVERMKTDLALDANQQTAVQELVDVYDKRMQDLRNDMRQTPEQIKQMADLRDKMKKANEANDQDAIKAVSEEMQQLRKAQMDHIGPARERMAKTQDELKEKLRAVLREDQRAGFDKLWDENMTQGARSRVNPRMLKSMIDRLTDLSAEQKQQISELMKRSDEAVRSQKDLAPAQREAQNQRTCDSLLAVLTPEQREKVQARIEGRPGALPREPAGNPHPPTKP